MPKKKTTKKEEPNKKEKPMSMPGAKRVGCIDGQSLCRPNSKPDGYCTSCGG